MSKPAWEIVAAARDGGGQVPRARLAALVEQSRLESEIAAFARRGYGFTVTQDGTLVLVKWPKRLFAEEISCGLGTEVVARRAQVHWTTTSTNDLARADARRAREGTAVFSEEQTRGRGRFGSTWVAPKFSSILFSTALYSPGSQVEPDALALAGAASVAEAIAQVYNLPARIRWPNDVLIEGRKVSGTLVEGLPPGADGQWLVIGLGVNVNLDPAAMPEELREKAGSISHFLGHEVDRAHLARALLRRLDFWWEVLKAGEAARLSELSRKYSSILGTFVTVESKGKRVTGRVVDVDAEIGLVLQLDGGPTRAFAPAETSLVS